MEKETKYDIFYAYTFIILICIHTYTHICKLESLSTIKKLSRLVENEYNVRLSY